MVSQLFVVPTFYYFSGYTKWFNLVDIGMVLCRQFPEDFPTRYTIVYIQKVKHKFICYTGFAIFDFDFSRQRYTEKAGQKGLNEFENHHEFCDEGFPALWVND
jgi:hypothetical protein